MMSNSILRIRVFATLVIVAYHCACPYYMWQWAGYGGDAKEVKSVVDLVFLRILSNTMLPTFFMISGMLFYTYKEHYSDRLKTLWKKFDRLIIPYCLITTFVLGLGLNKIGVSSADGHLWFVRDLFIMFALSLLCYRVKESKLVVVGVLTYVLFFIKSKTGIETNEIVEHLLNYYIFFIGGGIVATKYYLLRKRAIAVILNIIWLLTLIMGIQTLYVIFFNLILVAWVSDTKVENKILLSINRCSFGIYLLHHVFIFAAFYIPFMYRLYANNAILAFASMFLMSLSVSWLTTYLLHKIQFRYF